MLNGSIDDRGRFQSKEVEFHQTGIFDPFHLELRYEVIAAAWVAHHRDDIANVGIGNDDACGMSPMLTHETLKRSEEHTSELQSLMRISYAVFCLKKNKSNSHKKQAHARPNRNTNRRRLTRSA